MEHRKSNFYFPHMLTLNPADRKFWPKTTEPGFSIAKNNFVINDAIKKHDLNVKKKNAEFDNKLGERVDAVTSYLTGRQGVARSRSIEDYLGKIQYGHMRGQSIKNKLIQQQKMMIGNNKKLQHEQKEAQNELQKAVLAGKGKKIRRTNAKKEQKSSKKV